MNTLLNMGVWQGTAMDFLKCYLGPAIPTFYALQVGHP
jgi:hypothetical protein